MILSEHVRDIALSATPPSGTPTTLNLSLILDPVQGPTLVDTGFPGMLELLRAALAAEGVALADIRRVLVTHHDLDHIGLLPDVVRESGAEVWASAAEVPFVQGQQSPQKRPAAPPLGGLEEICVSRVLEDGEVLDLAGGVRVVATPGHTVGHLSFLVEKDGVLISGDALTSQDGTLHGPNPQFTPDLPQAARSVRALAALAPAGIQTYHGGFVSRDAAEQLRALPADAE
jgi:glyoxylase-like metal-dependent hydrolase (beta-lactamase superfamily II)